MGSYDAYSLDAPLFNLSIFLTITGTNFRGKISLDFYDSMLNSHLHPIIQIKLQYHFEIIVIML